MSSSKLTTKNKLTNIKKLHHEFKKQIFFVFLLFWFVLVINENKLQIVKK